MLRQVPAEQLSRAGADFRNCVGLSLEQLADTDHHCLSPHIAGVVRASLAQLELVLPEEAVVLGPLEGTFRGQFGGITWLHHDEHRTSDVYLQQVLFPLPRPDLEHDLASPQSDYLFERYNDVRTQMHARFPGLELPSDAECQGDLWCFTGRIIAAIAAYQDRSGCSGEDELVLDIINVWIPMDDKRMALLPLRYSGPARFQHETRPSADEVEVGALQHEFRAFHAAAAVLFFGRHVIHQVAQGREFAQCTRGSMETRYLVIMPRRRAHRCAHFRDSCISRTSVPQELLNHLNTGVAARAAEELARASEAEFGSSSLPCKRDDEDGSEVSSLGDEPHLAWYLSLWS